MSDISEAIFYAGLFIFLTLTWGEPSILDAISHWLMQ